MDENVTLVQKEYDPAMYCPHQILTSTTTWGDSIGITTRVVCRDCGKTIEIPHVTLMKERAFEGIIELTFGRAWTS